jgi:ribosomal protein S18 acetylase RimI-like enzyme
MRLRPATEDDAEVAAQLIIAVDVAHLGEVDYSLEALHDEWNEVGFELATDAVIVEDGQDVPIAYAHFREDDLVVAVDPRREGEGAGSAVLDWAACRGREKGLSELRQAVGARGTSARALLERRGWSPVRSYWRMERDVSPADEEPPGLRPVTERDAPALFAIYEASFGRVAAYRPTTAEAWTQREFGAHGFDPALGRVADGRGFALAHRWEDGVAYLSILAVHPDHAGQGLGSALLRGVFAAAGAAGWRQVHLNVASDNPDALRLYERVGMSQRWRVDDYHAPLPD